MWRLSEIHKRDLLPQHVLSECVNRPLPEFHLRSPFLPSAQYRSLHPCGREADRKGRQSLSSPHQSDPITLSSAKTYGITAYVRTVPHRSSNYVWGSEPGFESNINGRMTRPSALLEGRSVPMLSAERSCGCRDHCERVCGARDSISYCTF